MNAPNYSETPKNTREAPKSAIDARLQAQEATRKALADLMKQVEAKKDEA